MNQHNTNADDSASAAPRQPWRWKIAAVLALAAAGTSFAFGGPMMHGHRGHMAMSPAAMDAHIDKMVEQCAAGASADQKSRLSVIAKAAVKDLRAEHEQLNQGHVRLHELLAAPVIDRAALEQLRVTQMQHMDAMSKRMLAAAEEGAEVLTPDQRRQCATRLGTLMH